MLVALCPRGCNYLIFEDLVSSARIDMVFLNHEVCGLEGCQIYPSLGPDTELQGCFQELGAPMMRYLDPLGFHMQVHWMAA